MANSLKLENSYLNACFHLECQYRVDLAFGHALWELAKNMKSEPGGVRTDTHARCATLPKHTSKPPDLS
jgi:hypothetical protein